MRPERRFFLFESPDKLLVLVPVRVRSEHVDGLVSEPKRRLHEGEGKNSSLFKINDTLNVPILIHKDIALMHVG